MRPMFWRLTCATCEEELTDTLYATDFRDGDFAELMKDKMEKHEEESHADEE